MVNGFSFVGWTYDRFLMMVVLCDCDFLENIPGWQLKKLHAAMDGMTLPAALVLPAGAAHPPLESRPTVWRETSNLVLYIGKVLRNALKTDAEREVWAQRAVSAYWAFRHHPVFRLTSLEGVIDASMRVAVASPLEALPEGAADREWLRRVPGVVLHASDDVATQVARGALQADSLEPRDLGAGGDADSEASDGVAAAGAADGVAAAVPELTLATVETATSLQLLAWLEARASLEPYSADSLEKLRTYARTLLSLPGGPPPPRRWAPGWRWSAPSPPRPPTFPSWTGGVMPWPSPPPSTRLTAAW